MNRESTPDAADGTQSSADPQHEVDRSKFRAVERELALESAMRKRRAGVPTYTIPETAAVLSVSHEHLYRQVRRGLFPALKFNGRYVVPAQAVEELLSAASATGGCLDLADWASNWHPARGGAA